MQVSQAFDVAALWRVLPVVVLGWLALFFGRTLRPGRVPLIERIARVRDPELTPVLCAYTRRLTALWTLYFIVAALLTTTAALPFLTTSALIWSAAIALFVGEHWLRPRVFPGQSFPNLMQQIHDTASVWRRAP